MLYGSGWSGLEACSWAKGGDGRDPISRILFPQRGGDHFSGTGVASGLERPTRRACARTIAVYPSYLVFLRVGFTLPALSPEPRCALTAPFHPYLAGFDPRLAVCFLWHFP
jgi:hypothetical protein